MATNRNVALTFAYKLCDGLAQGLWNMAVLSNYIALLGSGTPHASEMVGYAQAIQGTCEAATALPAGWLAGRMRRDILLRYAGVISFFAIATLTAATMLPLEYKYLVLCIAMCLWGGQEATRPVLDSLFADSISTGQRGSLYSALFATAIMGVAIGPFGAALILWLCGNEWSVVTLERVIQLGMVLALVPAVLLFCFDDNRTLGIESEGVLAWTNQQTSPEQEPLLSNGQANGVADNDTAHAVRSAAENASTAAEPAGQDQSVEQGSQASGVSNGSGARNGSGVVVVNGVADEQAGENVVGREREAPVAALPGFMDQSVTQRRACGYFTAAFVPASITISNCIFGLASGMTVKFFPIFFKEEVGLSPTTLNILFGIVPLLMSPMCILSQLMASSGLGRIQTILICKTVGISLLFYMAYHKAIWTNASIIVPIWVSRTILMNSVSPLYKSVLMDYAPKGQRGIWSSVGSIASFGWSGSAAFGGWMIQHYEFGATFGITACMQVLGLMVVLPLVQLVPRYDSALAVTVVKPDEPEAAPTEQTPDYQPPQFDNAINSEQPKGSNRQEQQATA